LTMNTISLQRQTGVEKGGIVPNHPIDGFH
jgi:hypothetical protein